MNILWVQPNKTLALTSVFQETVEKMETLGICVEQISPDIEALAACEIPQEPDNFAALSGDEQEEIESSAARIINAKNAIAMRDKLTALIGGSTLEAYAAYLIQIGNIPADWTLAGTNVDWPETGWRHEAHRWNGQKVVVDFDVAVEETKTRLRAERAPLLSALDVKFQRNIETNADNSAVITEKNRLRDITGLTKSCATLDELRALSCS